MKKYLLWLWLLTKRLYKKPTFLAILVLIPLLVLGYSAVNEQDSGAFVIALSGEAEPLTEQIFAHLQESSQLIRYEVCENAQQAELLVRTGKADGAWIFPEDLQGCIDDFIKDTEEYGSFVRVIQREENVAMMLTRERLSGILYPHIARSYYIRFMRKNYEQLENLSDEELLQYYDGTEMAQDLFAYDDAQMEKTQSVHYLLAPLRGLLAVVVILGSLAAGMYTVSDRKRGTFQWVPARYQMVPEFATQWLTAINLGAAAWIALALSGMAKDFGVELAALLIYSLCASAFGMLLRRVLCSVRVMGAAVPILVAGMLLCCPVFFDLGVLRPVQLLLPPTYYINSVYNPAYLGYMALYSLICLLLCLGFDKLRNKIFLAETA